MAGYNAESLELHSLFSISIPPRKRLLTSLYPNYPGQSADKDDSTASGAASTTSSSMLKTSQGCAELAVEQCQGVINQLAKNALFGSSSV